MDSSSSQPNQKSVSEVDYLEDIITNDPQLCTLISQWDSQPNAHSKGEIEYLIHKRKEKLVSEFYSQKDFQYIENLSLDKSFNTVSLGETSLDEELFYSDSDKERILNALQKEKTLLGGIDICFNIKNKENHTLIKRIRVRMCRFSTLITNVGNLKRVVKWYVEDSLGKEIKYMNLDFHFQIRLEISDSTRIIRNKDNIFINSEKLPLYIDVTY
jgi:hypothetical protein